MKLIMGAAALLGVLLLIAGPLLIFSSLNPLSEVNNVEGAGVMFSFEIHSDGGASNLYPIFEANHMMTNETLSNTIYQQLSDNYGAVLASYPPETF